jgi:signal transduction histidine kinase
VDPRAPLLLRAAVAALLVTMAVTTNLLLARGGGEEGAAGGSLGAARERALRAAHAVEVAALSSERRVEAWARALVSFRAIGGRGLPAEVRADVGREGAVSGAEWLPTVPAEARGRFEEMRGWDWGAIPTSGAPLRIVEPLPPVPEPLREKGLPPTPRFAAARAEHHPLVLAAGFVPGPEAIGMDLGALPEVAEAIARARSSRGPALTGRSRLVEGSGAEEGAVLRLLLAVTAPPRAEGPGGPSRADPESLGAGFIAMLLDPRRLAALGAAAGEAPLASGAAPTAGSGAGGAGAPAARGGAAGGEGAPALSVTIEDPEAPPGARLLARSGGAAPAGGVEPPRAPRADPSAIVHPVRLGGRVLLVTAAAPGAGGEGGGEGGGGGGARGLARTVLAIGGGLAALLGVGAIVLAFRASLGAGARVTEGTAGAVARGGAAAAPSPEGGADVRALEERLGAALESLARSEDRARAIFGAVPDAMYRITADGTVFDCKTLGWKGLSTPAAHITSRRLPEVFPEAVAGRIGEVVRSVLSRGEMEVLRYSAPSRDASKGAGPRFFEARIAPQGAGEALAIVRDTTQQADLERLKQEFLSTVSHEMKTPLTALRGALQLLLAGAHGPMPEASRELCEIAALNAERITALLNDLIDLERMAAGKLAFDVRDVAPGEIVTSVVSGLRGVARQAKVEVETDLARRDLVRGDARRLAQVLTNLVGNAIRYAPEGSVVRVEVDAGAPGRLRFSVRDRGPGIPPEDQARLFQRFVQLRAAPRAPHAGSGLGLAVSKGIVEGHGGEIGVVSTPGDGARFWFDVPLATRTPGPAEGGSAAPAEASAEGASQLETGASRNGDRTPEGAPRRAPGAG